LLDQNLDSGLQTKPYVFQEVAISSALLVLLFFGLFVLAMRRLRLINIF
jgi:hypothetical protein